MLGKSLIALALAAAPTVWAVAAAEVPSTKEWAGKVVPIEAFGHFPTLSAPRISPDGTIIAAKARSGDTQVLALVPAGEAGAKPLIIARDGDFSRNKEGEERIFDYRWIDDDNLLIVVGSRQVLEGSWYDETRAVAYNRVTRKITRLGWDHARFGAGDVLWMSPPGTRAPHLLIQRGSDEYNLELYDKPEVIDVDVATGNYKVVVHANPLVQDWRADENGVVRVGTGSDRDTGKVRVLYRPDGNSNFTTIVRERADMHNDLVAPSIFLKGSDKAYALSNRDGYRALYEYDLATMNLGKKVFAVDGYDVGGASTTPDGSALQSLHWTDQRSRTKFLDPRLNDIQSVLEESFGKGNVTIDSADLKRQKIVFTYAELGQAPTVFLFDTVTGKMTRLAYFNDALKDAHLNPVSVVRYPTSDGKQVEAVLTMPRHRVGQKNLPLIVMPHGGPWARDDADWDPYLWAQALAEQGYVVIQPNYRGSTGYGRDWGKASDGNWGERMQDDLNDAIPWLAAQGIADPKRACMFGWSYGGYAASRAAQRDGARFRCAISGAGVHDLPAMVAYDKDYLGPYGAKIAMGAAGSNLRAISPAAHPEQYSAPILIIHGARDQRVPVGQSRNLVSRLKGAGKVEGRDFVYVEQPLNTHNLLREEDRIQVLTEVKKFLDRFNPA
ncbi:MAG TPA: S9 family peptidase [Allosphingosinicella sp.]|jgi:dipeptidyl aminopeptidase/acylaminoacyl peptidase